MNIRATTNFSRLPEFRAAVTRGVNEGLTAAAMTAAEAMRRGMSRGPRWASSSPGSAPNVQRGGLRGSVTFTPSTNFRSSAGSGLKYAKIHETGGVIQARGSLIPVPLNIAARRLREKVPGSLRSEDLQVIPRRGKPPLLVGKKRVKAVRYLKGGKKLDVGGEPVFVLVRQVTIPPRPWAWPAVRNNADRIAGAARRTAAKSIRAFTISTVGGAR